MTQEFATWLGLGAVAISCCAIVAAVVTTACASVRLKRSVERVEVEKVVRAVAAPGRFAGRVEESGYHGFGVRMRIVGILLLVPLLAALAVTVLSVWGSD